MLFRVFDIAICPLYAPQSQGRFIIAPSKLGEFVASLVLEVLSTICQDILNPVSTDGFKAIDVAVVFLPNPLKRDVVVAIFHPALDEAVPEVSPVRVTDCFKANSLAVEALPLNAP